MGNRNHGRRTPQHTPARILVGSRGRNHRRLDTLTRFPENLADPARPASHRPSGSLQHSQSEVSKASILVTLFVFHHLYLNDSV